MRKLFFREKRADRRIIHFFGLKFSYKRKYDINAIDKEKVQNEINNFKDSGINSTNRSPKIIVSLTSFAQRLYDIHFGIYSLLTQSVKPDMVILWLGEDEFPNKDKDLPESLVQLKQNGLTIKYCKDIRSYTKLVPAMKEYPNDIIVTADDDIFYENNWLEILYKSYLDNPNFIHCHRANGITTSKKEINSDRKWTSPSKMNSSGASFKHFLTGVGGVLYPPNCLYKDVLNEEIFMKCSPRHDDAWFWAMAVLNNTKINIVNNNINSLTYVNPERELQLIDEVTLWSMNKKQADSQISKILERYPQIIDIVTSEKN